MHAAGDVAVMMVRFLLGILYTPPRSTKRVEACAERLKPYMVSPTQAQTGQRRISMWSMAQLCAVYGAITAHIFIMAYADPLTHQETVTNILLFSLQFFLLLAVLLCFFLLTSQGVYVQLNLYDRYLRQHRAFFITGALALAAFLGMGVYSLISSYRHVPAAMVWKQPAYYPLWIAMRMLLLLFQCCAAYAAPLALQQTGLHAPNGDMAPI